jgi:hypothetical protein
MACAAMAADGPDDLAQLQSQLAAARQAAEAANRAFYALEDQFMLAEQTWRERLAETPRDSTAISLANQVRAQASVALGQARAAMESAWAQVQAFERQLAAAIAAAAAQRQALLRGGVRCGLYGVIAAEVAFYGYECVDLYNSQVTYLAADPGNGTFSFLGQVGSNYGYYCNPFNWNWRPTQ